MAVGHLPVQKKSQTGTGTTHSPLINGENEQGKRSGRKEEKARTRPVESSRTRKSRYRSRTPKPCPVQREKSRVGPRKSVLVVFRIPGKKDGSVKPSDTKYHGRGNHFVFG